MEYCDTIISTETLISEKYLWDGSHSWFCHYFHEEFLIICDIYFLVCSTDRSEEIFCFYAVWTIVLGVESYHSRFLIFLVSSFSGILFREQSYLIWGYRRIYFYLQASYMLDQISRRIDIYIWFFCSYWYRYHAMGVSVMESVSYEHLGG